MIACIVKNYIDTISRYKFHSNSHLRFTVTSVSLVQDEKNINNKEDVKLVLTQVAEKDVRFKFDSKVVFEMRDGVLVMTTTVETDKGPVSGTRTFSWFDLDNLHGGSRRGSYLDFLPVVKVPSRRGSYNVASQSSSEVLDSERVSEALQKTLGRRLSVPRIQVGCIQPSQGPMIDITEHD